MKVLAQVRIEELEKFVAAFSTRGAAMRGKHGSRGAQVFRVADDAETVYVLFDWKSREAFERFLIDPEVPATMRSSGTVGRPEFTILEEFATFPA